MPIFSSIARNAVYNVLNSPFKNLTKWLAFQAGVSVASQRYSEIIKMAESKLISLFVIACMVIFVIFSFFFGVFFLTLAAIFAIGQFNSFVQPFSVVGGIFMGMSLLLGLFSIFKIKHFKLKVYGY